MPERATWSIPVKQGDYHVIAAPGSGGLSVMLMQKEGAGVHKDATKEEGYEKQYHGRTRILIIDDEPDITLGFR
jgi:hypothetical protein